MTIGFMVLEQEHRVLRRRSRSGRSLRQFKIDGAQAKTAGGVTLPEIEANTIGAIELEILVSPQFSDTVREAQILALREVAAYGELNGVSVAFRIVN